MVRLFVSAAVLSMLLFAATFAEAGNRHCRGKCHAQRGGLFGWRHYSKEERRNFPTCYGGYERYYGGFHANYFRDYPGNHDGLTNDRYGWGNGWAW